MFRRPFRRIPMGNVPPALQHATRLMASGEYTEAAGIYEQFAEIALARNGPRTPWFFLQAGQARLLQGQVSVGMQHILQGLGLLAARGQLQKLYHAGTRFTTELNSRGHSAEATQLQDYLKKTLPAGFVPRSGAGLEAPHPVLPTTCPGCGGPIRSDEVDWVDAVTAECPYCGSAVRGQV